MLGICLREAQYMLNMFEQQGKTIRNGRSKLVLIDAFAAYLCEQDGGDTNKRKREIQDLLWEAEREKRRSAKTTK
jgi:hypothetical protein